MKFSSLFSRLRRQITAKRVRVTLLLLLLALAAYFVHLDSTVRIQFEGKRFALPARVYARPLELFVGMKMHEEALRSELTLLRYTSDLETLPNGPGHYVQAENTVVVAVRPFTFWDGAQPARTLRITFQGGHITDLVDAESSAKVDLARLDPVPIGGIYPAKNEDRVLINLEQAPHFIIDALLAVEDRRFYSHYGIDPRGIARAALTVLTNQRAQGGSTLTQQLVKNFFLTPERTLRRKFTEVLMALLLELHYDKDDILETYLNEVYLGQDRNRAIHGFGLASQFYFDRSIEQLELHQAALLVGMLKGPTYYDPRRHPERALERRNLVLAELAQQDFIDEAQYAAARDKPLDVTPQPGLGISPYPAFLELVHRQLRRDYREEDLRTEGLQIFTTLDPMAQNAAERSLTRRLDALEQSLQLPDNTLEGAVVITSTQNGEVHAVVGGRHPQFEGFNRALDAARQIGSLLKPALYLTALAQPERYTLVTPLDDSKLVWQEPGIDDWEPNNYDNEFHGEVPLREALAKSYNVASARLGLTLGVDKVIASAHQLGIERELPGYASTLLGTTNLTPFEVTQMYHTIASGGFRMPLRAIREVLTLEGEPLQRYGLAVEQAVAEAPIYLLTAALQDVVQEGTARGLSHYLPAQINAAGKTGTTDDLRDSWFAGFTGDRVAVVWVGNDENQSTHLTGATGALTVWGDIMRQLDPEPLLPPQPENVEQVPIDPASGLRVAARCNDAVKLPFIRGSAPEERISCPSQGKGIGGWFKQLLGND